MGEGMADLNFDQPHTQILFLPGCAVSAYTHTMESVDPPWLSISP